MRELLYPNFERENIRRFWGGFGIKKLIMTDTSNYEVFTGQFSIRYSSFYKAGM